MVRAPDVHQHYYDDIIVIVVGCNASSVAAILRVSEEHSEIRWVDVGDLGQLSVPANYRSAIEQ